MAAKANESVATQDVPESGEDASKAVKAKADVKLLEESKQRSLDVIAGTQSLLTIAILVLACIVAFSSRLFAVIRFESIIHEFDPWCVCVCVCAWRPYIP